MFIIQNGRTALAWAAHEGHEHVVDLLLKAGANPDNQDPVTESVCTDCMSLISHVYLHAMIIVWRTSSLEYYTALILL